MRKSKAKLIFTLSVALLSVFTMGVSTFAWFQANAQVNVEAAPATTTITVSAPNSVNVTSAKLYRRNTSYNTIPTNITFVEGAGDTQFTEITGNVVSFANLEATDLATFCVVISASSGSSYKTIDNAELKLVSYSTEHPGSYHFYKLNAGKTATDGEINFTDALLISGAYTTAANTAYAFSSGSTITTNKVLASGTSISSYSLYMYFTIQFSNVNTTYYQEYVKVNNTSYQITHQDQPNTKDRYFASETSGNSNCYAGWSFTIHDLLVTLS